MSLTNPLLSFCEPYRRSLPWVSPRTSSTSKALWLTSLRW
jgi:hypothetical protein